MRKIAVIIGIFLTLSVHAVPAVWQPESNHDAGALKQPVVRIPPGGKLELTLTCDAVRPNYLTVRLWGSETGTGMLFLQVDGKRIGEYMKDLPELDYLTDQPACPGRFYYSTYRIPPELTQGKNALTFQLSATGGPAPYNSDPQKRINPGRNPSRGIYGVYRTADPFFVPPSALPTGQAPLSVRQPANHTETAAWDHLKAVLDQGIGTSLQWQYYGAEWERAAAAHQAPSWLTGAIVEQGAGRDAAWPESIRKNQLAARIGGNDVVLLLPEIYARAWNSPWSQYYHRPELVDRVRLALDYLRRLQGANGGFDDHHRWIGGPQRGNATSCLEGFGLMGPPMAFLLLENELMRPELLREKIDDDADPATPQKSRRQVYTDLFRNARNYLVSRGGRGHAPNQDNIDLLAALLCDRALKTLAPELAWPRETVENYAEIAVGLRPDPYGGYWISAKGVSMEPNGSCNGGYCGNYGSHVLEPAFRLADLTGNPEIRARALRLTRTFAYFLYPALDADGQAVFRKDGIITWRNNKTPGVEYYEADAFAAVHDRDPVSQREIRLALNNGYFQRLELNPRQPHFVAELAYQLRQSEYYRQAFALPDSGFRLPFEAGQPDFAWADEQAACVVVKHRGARLTASLNWRHGFQGKQRSPQSAVVNNLARISYRTADTLRIANVAMESRDGFQGFYVCRYGDYLIGMNASAHKSYPLAVPGNAALELITQRRVGGTVSVPPGHTAILYLGK